VSKENPDRDRKEPAASSKREIEAHAGASADEKTRRLTPAPTPYTPSITDVEALEPTRRFAASSEAQTTLHKAPETEPTSIFSKDKTEREADELKVIPDENALRPSRLRFVLVCLLFVNMFVVAGVEIYQASLVRSALPYVTEVQADSLVIVSVRPGFEGAFRVGDELVSVNGVEVNPSSVGRVNRLRLAPTGEQCTVVVRRGGQLREVETVSVAPPLSYHLSRILFLFLYPAVFLVTGFLIFLLKPNNKQALLLALLFGSFIRTGSIWDLSDSPPLLIVKVIALLFISLPPPLFLHFCLVFPERSLLLRRFPKLERLIYLPHLLILLPTAVLLALLRSGYPVVTDFSSVTVRENATDITYCSYALAGLLVLILSYRRTNESARRRLRVVVVSLLCGITPFLLTIFVLDPLLWASARQNPWEEWTTTIIFSPILLVPPAFAYAIVRHRVIPVSLIIRRGLQYLLAKNALRLLLILPVLGIIWNVAANPHRTLGEILFQNSVAFYVFVVVAVVDGVLLRSRLNEWIDRRFFREQYDQERLLHELIEDVKESDSMPKLSRLVSSRIQSALHPTSVHLFYEDRRDSDFSVGYTTSENSADLKLSADSPLLRFMQTRRGAVEIPLRDGDNLPPRERDWLRSIGAELLVPMQGTDGKLAGFFSLGGKKSEIPYTQRDRELLETLATQIALVQENLSLKDRVRHEQRIKAEVLSRFDAGDINLLKECPRCGKCFDRTIERCDEDGAELTFPLPVERTIESRYRLERLIGKGGMGAVYEATDARINRRVAVKILSGAMFGNRDALRRFEREAQTAGRLQHPNIITVFDYGVLSTEGAFLVMELFRGESLRQILEREGRLDAGTIVAWFDQVMDGVEAAHKQGIVHRDLKPDNILVSQSENGAARLCILDFGLARLNEQDLTAQSVTVPGTVMGTFGYMPPEQLRGERADERSDLFAVGVMIYEALFGKKPFRGKSYQELLRAMSSDQSHPELDRSLRKFFEKSLALEPAARFASAVEMKRVLLTSDFAVK
jgi:eukaryotic-like serine/threonine-protein kinase